MITKLAIAALLLGAQPASAHCYSIWHYKTAQHCGVTRAAYHAPAPQAKPYYVEITTPPAPVPAVKTIPLPAVEAIPEKDQRTPEEILDQKEHDAAVAAHKDEINKLMIILHAEEAAKTKAGIE
jgi:hypothetical protein